jgi:hypothetical protein
VEGKKEILVQRRSIDIAMKPRIELMANVLIILMAIALLVQLGHNQFSYDPQASTTQKSARQ